MFTVLSNVEVIDTCTFWQFVLCLNQTNSGRRDNLLWLNEPNIKVKWKQKIDRWLDKLM